METGELHALTMWGHAGGGHGAARRGASGGALTRWGHAGGVRGAARRGAGGGGGATRRGAGGETASAGAVGAEEMEKIR